MKSIRFNVGVLIPIILLSIVAFNSETALGYNIDVSFDPTPVERNVGEVWSFDIIFNGEIGRPLYRFDYRFRYDPDVIEYSSASYGSWINAWNYSTTGIPTVADYSNFSELELAIDSGYYSVENQLPRSVTNEIFATVHFKAIGEGTSLFESSGYGYASTAGYEHQYFNVVQAGEITVSGAPVPEPATVLLVGSGLIGLAGYRRRNSRKK